MPAGSHFRDLLIINKRGLHARASAKFVQMVERFNAQVWVTRGGETVGGTSIMGLMMLAAGPGTTITVSAAGPDAQAALDGDYRARQRQIQRRRDLSHALGAVGGAKARSAVPTISRQSP